MNANPEPAGATIRFATTSDVNAVAELVWREIEDRRVEHMRRVTPLHVGWIRRG